MRHARSLLSALLGTILEGGYPCGECGHPLGSHLAPLPGPCADQVDGGPCPCLEWDPRNVAIEVSELLREAGFVRGAAPYPEFRRTVERALARAR